MILASALSAQIFIDCGSPTDQYFTGGFLFVITTPGATGDLTLRYGAFSYDIPVDPGTYRVGLLFRETGTVSARNQRIFSVRINDQPVVDRLDLYATAGLNPLRRDYLVFAGASIKIDFSYTTRSAIISAIEITPFGLAPAERKTISVTEQVPVWYQTAYAVPHPPSDPNANDLLYINEAVFLNGLRQRAENQTAGLADYKVIQRTGQLRFAPINGLPWDATDTITVDYTAVYPQVPAPTLVP